MMKHDYYVYKHTNKNNGKCYIGISCQEPDQRWRSGLGYKDQSKFYGAILKYGWDGFNHEILFSNLSQEEAYTLEKELIAKYNSIENGYNIQSGGDDVGIWARDNLSVPIYQLDPIDFHIIQEYESISDAAREYECGAPAIASAVREKGTSLGYYWARKDEFGNNWSPRNNLNETSIYKIDKDTFSILEKYKSIIEAAKKNNISPSGLHRCEDFFSLGGFCWCKCSDWYEGWKPSKKPNTATPVYQIEIGTLKILNEWQSIVEASQVLKISKTLISRCCKRKGIVAGGFHWCKVEDWNSDWKPKEIGQIGSGGRSVYQIDKNTLEIINTFDNATQAAREIGVPNTCISKAACGDMTESGGYYWCYVDIYKDWSPKKKKKTGPEGRPVIQLSLNGAFIKEWNSLGEAARHFGIRSSNITNVCAGRSNSIAGFKWKYKE